MDAKLIDFDRIVGILNEIPLHQRNYSWQEKHWRRLWSTLVQAYLDADTSGVESGPGNVFMGAMVRLNLEPQTAQQLRLQVGRKWSQERSAIVDGQQRVVTLCVLLTAIRDTYYGARSVGWSSVTEDYLRFRLGRTTSEFGDLRLRVQANDREAYAKVTAPKTSLDDLLPLKDLDSLVAKAYLFFMSALGRPAEDQFEYLSQDLFSEDASVDERSDDDAEHQEDFDRVEDLGIEPDQLSDQGLGFVPVVATSDEIDWSSRGMFDPEALVSLIGSHLKFAVVELDTDDEALAFEIFETLNDANEPLSNVDKFRNGYFMLEPDDAEEIYREYWLPLEAAHGEGTGRYQDLRTLEDFFFNETIRRFGWTPSSKTYQRLMGYIKAKAQTATGGSPTTRRRNRRKILNEEFQAILRADRAYRRLHGWLLQKESETPPTVQTHLGFLRDFSAAPMKPLVMELLLWSEEGQNGQAARENLAQGLKAIEGFLSRRVLGGVHPQQLRSQVTALGPMLRDRLKELDSADPEAEIGEAMRDLFRALTPDKYPDDLTLKSSQDVPIYERVGRGIQLFRVLWGIEQELSSDHAAMAVPPYGTGSNRWSVEHVMPQGIPVPRQSNRGRPSQKPELDPKWAEYWRERGVVDVDREFRTLRHTLGNLTLLRGRDNSYVGTKSFSEKKDFYRTHSDLKLSKGIADSEDWLPADIRARADVLIEVAIRRWPY